jgi:phage regulator Rha-like protein
MKRTKSQLAAAALPLPIETIERRIYLIRSQKVMLDSDLADLYHVPTKSLNLAVRRNADRFPEDFMFQLTKEEVSSLRFQFETSNKGRGGRRYLPHAFTEHGVAMLSSVLNSKRAVQVNILIIRAFVKLREMLSTHKDLARKLEELEKKYQAHDVQIKAVFDAIRKLIEQPVAPRRRIGFATQPQK